MPFASRAVTSRVATLNINESQVPPYEWPHAAQLGKTRIPAAPDNSWVARSSHGTYPSMYIVSAATRMTRCEERNDTNRILFQAPTVGQRMCGKQNCENTLRDRPLTCRYGKSGLVKNK